MLRFIEEEQGFGDRPPDIAAHTASGRGGAEPGEATRIMLNQGSRAADPNGVNGAGQGRAELGRGTLGVEKRGEFRIY